MPNHWTLVMETCVPEATLVLARDEVVVSEAQFMSERCQEVDLFAPLQEVLSALPEGETLSQVVVGTGPGSYNGARVGIAAAQAIAQVHDCGVAGLCSFEGVPGLSWAVGDARRGSFFLMKVGQEPKLLSLEDFRAKVLECEGRKGTFESVEKLECGEVEIEKVSPTAAGLLKSWYSRNVESQAKVSAIPAEAFYLRPPHITVSKKSQS